MNEWRQWDQKDINLAAELWKAGNSASAIADRVNRSRNAVLGLMNRDRDLFPKRGKGASTSRAASAAGSAKRSTRLNSFNVPVLRRARAAALEASKAAPAPEPAAAPEPVSPIWAEGRERGAKSDLSRFRLADLEPKSFASLGRSECRFPLVCFEAPSGPDMPCCGAETDPLKSYCDAHLAVMAGRV